MMNHVRPYSMYPPLLPDQRRSSHPSGPTRHFSHPLHHHSQPGSHRLSIGSSIGQGTSASVHPRPRPHPHLNSSILFIDHVPSDLPEQDIAQALQECLPVRIILGQSVPPHLRLKPDAYYDWMPKTGKLEFEQKHNAEKALAILHIHPLFAGRGITISPYPSPQLVPLAESPARHIRPTRRVQSPSAPPPGPHDPLVNCPSPGQIFDALRPWGSLRMVQVWAEVPPEGTTTLPGWNARVEFWYEDEAKRFEVGFGQTASVINNWQIAVVTELPSSVPIILPSLPPMLPLALPPTPGPLGPPSNYDMKFTTPAPYLQPMFDPAPGGALQASIGPMPIAPPHPGANPQVPFPNTPPQTTYTPPWASHNPFTISHTDMPGPPPSGLPFPVFPASPPPVNSPGIPPNGSPMSPAHRQDRRMSSISRTSMSSLRSSRNRNWSLTIAETPDGETRATGLVSDDGQYIAHGPGQHIRPAPVYGPGSRSASGLVDYSNVFVKNLDPDINSDFLSQLFSNIGRIISARVMRDESNRSRGYGFVSFHTPEEALRAINVMDGQMVGRQLIAVTLHEPRRLRPDKIAERTMREQPTAYGRTLLPQRSMSNLRGTTFSHTPAQVEQKALGTNDEIRLLSPKTREAALTRRVAPRVRAYVRQHAVSESLVTPTVQALVADDLQLLPLLYNVDRLRDKISNTIKGVQQDAEAQMLPGDTKASSSSVGLDSITRPASPQSTPPNNRSTDADGPKTPLNLSSDELAIFRSEILSIDLVEAETIMALLLSRLTPEDAQKCLRNRQHLRLTANGIRRELLKSRMKIDTQVTQLLPAAELAPLSGLSQPSPIPSPIAIKATEGMDVDHAAAFTRLPLDEIELHELAGLPAEHALAHFEGDEGEQVMQKLSLAKPSGRDVSKIKEFVRKTRRKSQLEQRSDVVSLVARSLNYPALRRSQKAKLASDLVTTEDNDEAVCRLTLYPVLLEAKVGQLLGSPLLRRVSA